MRLSRIMTYFIAVAVLLLPVGRPVDATTVVALDDAALARGARTIVHGDVVSKESFVAAEGGRIYTEYRFAVRDLLKGRADADGTVVFREWGGEVGGTRYWIPGVNGYQLGEEVLTFLGEPDAGSGIGLTFGLAQGKFSVRREAGSGRALLTRDLGDLSTVEPRGDTRVPPPVPPPDVRDLEGFKTKIRAELAK
jgi:hypothetical protein